VCGGGGIAPPILTSALDGGEWSTSRPGRYTPGNRRLGGPQNRSGRCGGLLLLPGIEPRSRSELSRQDTICTYYHDVHNCLQTSGLGAEVNKCVACYTIFHYLRHDPPSWSSWYNSPVKNKNISIEVSFWALMVVTMNITLLWDMTPCRLVDAWGTRCHHLQARCVTTRSSETSVTIYRKSVASQKTTTFRSITFNHK
jgi:hypothetical protein